MEFLQILYYTVDLFCLITLLKQRPVFLNYVLKINKNKNRIIGNIDIPGISSMVRIFISTLILKRSKQFFIKSCSCVFVVQLKYYF